jgi:hypothetical protein
MKTLLICLLTISLISCKKDYYEIEKPIEVEYSDTLEFQLGKFKKHYEIDVSTERK